MRLFRTRVVAVDDSMSLEGEPVSLADGVTSLADGAAQWAGDHAIGGILSRRSFVVRLLGAVGGLTVGAVGIPIVGFLSAPALRGRLRPQLISNSVVPTLRSNAWSEAGPLADFKEGVPRLAAVQRAVSDGWVSGTQPVAVYLYRRSVGDVVAYDPHCTHLGCPLSWSGGAQRFLCPCHGGAFDADGQVVGGPPPRGLLQYDVRVEGDRVLIGGLREEG